ncbi:MAG: hypothetical protein LC745_07090 [Planctomycetia bacterium]|nr:hypothetical protein [Planctomycetia bacterium]
MPGFQHGQDVFDEVRGFELALKQTEVVMIEFDPEIATLEVFEPSRPEKSIPVFTDPTPDGPLSQISTRLFTLNPFVALSFLLAYLMDAQPDARSDGLDRWRTTLTHQDLRTTFPVTFFLTQTT